MSEESDPAAEPDLQARLLKAASRMGPQNKTERAVTSTDRTRVVKMIIARWEIRRGEYASDAPTDDELVNICIQTQQVRQASWMLYMSRSRPVLDLAYLIKRPLAPGGAPARQIQPVENDFNGPAWDTYQGLGIIKDNLGLIIRLGERGLFVYGHIGITPPGSGSVCFCLGDAYDPSAWRTIFPLAGLFE